jgi:hypothetical protein
MCSDSSPRCSPQPSLSYLLTNSALRLCYTVCKAAAFGMASPCGVGPTPWGNLNSFLQNFLCSTAGEIIFLGQFSQVFFYLVFFNYLVFFFKKKKKKELEKTTCFMSSSVCTRF